VSRILVVHNEIPFPPRHGGAVDVWWRLRAFAALGHSVLLCCWRRRGDAAGQLQAELAEHGIELASFTRRRRVGALWSHRPPQMVSLGLRGTEWRRLVELGRAFAPSWVLADGWPNADVALALGAALGRPVVYRSQNAEHEYWASLLASARWPLRWRIALTAGRVRGVEAEIRAKAIAVLEIAEEDAATCAGAGMVGHSIYLPPTWSGVAREAERPPTWDVLYGGNLWAPNNVEGLRWLLEAVVPRIRERVGTFRVVVAGAAPTAAVRRMCAATGVEIIADPEDLGSVMRRAGVLVNPVLRSGGVNLKVLEMLAAGAPIVSTSAGARGLPAAVRRVLTLADEPGAFAQAVAARLLAPATTDAGSRQHLLDDAFGHARVASAVREIDALCAQQTRAR